MEEKVNINSGRGRLPQISCELILAFSADEDLSEIIAMLGIDEDPHATNEGTVELSCGVIKDMEAWDVDAAVSMLLSSVNIDAILDIQKCHTCQCILDVWFYHHLTFPSIIFEGNNMRILRLLNADICIDPY